MTVGRGDLVVSTSDEYVGGLPIKSGILPLLRHACREAISCHAGCQEVSRFHTRDESQGSISHLPTLALKARGDVTRIQKQGYQWPYKKDLCPPKLF